MYSTITKETFNTICIAYPADNGIESEEGLNFYEANSEGTVTLIFVDNFKDAKELIKTF